MKKILSLYIIFILALVSLLGYNGCSQLDKNAVVAPAITTHPAGWADSTNTNFHGNFIASSNWNLSQCKTCHGGDYRGGTAGVSCYNCHTETNGPEACNTCHGSRTAGDTHPWPPQSLAHKWDETDRGVGVHNHHLSDDPNERYSAQVRCVSCHEKVNNFGDPTHLQNTISTATIHFDSLALNVLRTDTGTIHPSYDPVTNKCSNVYCHGNFKNGNRNFQPTFNDPASVYCGTCHGDPNTGNPTPKPNGQYVSPHLSFYTINVCYQCHSATIDQNGTIVAPERHINGIVDSTASSYRKK
jgi:predicted CxxxxCH...CXXCH cytochrome family protein